jgi:hypothetical protein
MCDDLLLSPAPEPAPPELPASWADVLQFAASFASLSLNRDGTIRVRTNVTDLLYIFGHYARHHSRREPLVDRLMLMSDVLKHIAQNLEED